METLYILREKQLLGISRLYPGDFAFQRVRNAGADGWRYPTTHCAGLESLNESVNLVKMGFVDGIWRVVACALPRIRVKIPEPEIFRKGSVFGCQEPEGTIKR